MGHEQRRRARYDRRTHRQSQQRPFQLRQTQHPPQVLRGRAFQIRLRAFIAAHAALGGVPVLPAETPHAAVEVARLAPEPPEPQTLAPRDQTQAAHVADVPHDAVVELQLVRVEVRAQHARTHGARLDPFPKVRRLRVHGDDRDAEQKHRSQKTVFVVVERHGLHSHERLERDAAQERAFDDAIPPEVRARVEPLILFARREQIRIERARRVGIRRRVGPDAHAAQGRAFDVISVVCIPDVRRKFRGVGVLPRRTDAPREQRFAKRAFPAGQIRRRPRARRRRGLVPLLAEHHGEAAGEREQRDTEREQRDEVARPPLERARGGELAQLGHERAEFSLASEEEPQRGGRVHEHQEHQRQAALELTRFYAVRIRPRQEKRRARHGFLPRPPLEAHPPPAPTDLTTRCAVLFAQVLSKKS